MSHLRQIFRFSSFLLSVAISLIFLMIPLGPHRLVSASASTAPSLHVSGTRILDSSGHTVLLRGAQIECSFSNAHGWASNPTHSDITKRLNPNVFNAMRSWHMNALRLSLSNWIYNSDPVNYLTLVDKIVQEANQAGIYTIIDLHDDDQSGSPYGSDASTPKPESVAFWT